MKNDCLQFDLTLKTFFKKFQSLLSVISWIQNYQYKPRYYKKEKKLYLKYFPNRHTNTYTFLTCIISINNSWFVKYFCFFIFQTIILIILIVQSSGFPEYVCCSLNPRPLVFIILKGLSGLSNIRNWNEISIIIIITNRLD